MHTDGLQDAFNGEGWLNPLREIVDINSGFTNVDGQRQVFDVLKGHFSRLGFEGRKIALDADRLAMSFEWPQARPELLLVGHVDTMFQPDSPFQTLKQDGAVLTGPGISDMKAGLVLILMLLERLADPGLLRKIRVFINDDEELGARYSRHALREDAKGLSVALIFEPGLSDGAFVLGYSVCSLGMEGRPAVPRTAIRYYERTEVDALAQHLCEIRDAHALESANRQSSLELQRLRSERLSTSGCSMVVGLGPYGGKTHTTDEFLRPETVMERLAAAEFLTRRLLTPVDAVNGGQAPS